MRQVLHILCAGLLGFAVYTSVPDAASAAPAVQAAPIERAASTDQLLQKVQGYGGGRYYRDEYEDEYAPPPPPPPPPPRPRYKWDPGWGTDGTPRWRADRFTPEFCYTCMETCEDRDSCAPRCWGWRRYCRRHGY